MEETGWNGRRYDGRDAGSSAKNPGARKNTNIVGVRLERVQTSSVQHAVRSVGGCLSLLGLCVPEGGENCSHAHYRMTRLRLDE